MASVTFENVSRIYDGQAAVDSLSMQVEDGEFLVLVGPSGCGKTTTLRMLAGLEAVSSGRILIGDRVVNNVAARDRDIAMVFQSYALYPHMSVFENMAFALKMQKVPKAEIDRRVREAAGILGIEQLLRRKPGQLSGGQRQRVALGRAIVRHPKVFLLDEPLSNLDAALRVQTRAELSKLHERLGTTFIYVTHDQVEAMTMATRIAVMNKGLLQQLGSPTELYDRPRNRFVAGFIGSPSMNFVEVEVTRNGDAVRLERPGLSVPLRAGSPAYGPVSALPRVVMGIRPENIHDPNFSLASENTVTITPQVELVERMGNETFLHLNLDGQTLLARVNPGTRAEAGSRFPLLVDLARTHYFDLDSDLRLEDGDADPAPDPAGADRPDSVPAR